VLGHRTRRLDAGNTVVLGLDATTRCADFVPRLTAKVGFAWWT
jgi:hypothetical protein